MFHVNGIIQRVSICTWLLSLRIMFSRLIHVAGCVRTSYLFVAESHFIEGIDHVSCIRLLQVSRPLSPLRLSPSLLKPPPLPGAAASHRAFCLRVFPRMGRSSSFLHFATPFTLAALSSQLIFTSKLLVFVFCLISHSPFLPQPLQSASCCPSARRQGLWLERSLPCGCTHVALCMLCRRCAPPSTFKRSSPGFLHTSRVSCISRRTPSLAVWCLLVRLSPSSPTRALSLTAGGPCRVVTSRLQVAASFPGPGHSLLGSLRVTLGAGCVVHSGSLPAQLGDSGPPRAGHAGLTSE